MRDYDIYETREKKPRRHPVRWALIKFFARLIFAVVTILALIVGALYVAPISLFMLDPGEDLAINGSLPVTHMNVLLLGVDSENYGQRSDSMMILSVGEDKMVLTSLMRDMLVEIPGYGQQKINAAHAHGGTKLAVQTVNGAFEMNISKYVRVDYLALVHAVDALGGVDVTITQEERDKINELVAANNDRLTADGYFISPLTSYGENTRLCGVQALAYSRIRKLDSDYNRTGRQRQVIEAMWKRLRTRELSITLVMDLWQVVREDVDTNLTWPEIAMLGLKAIRTDGIEMHRLPAEGTYTDDGSSLKIDPAGNAAALFGWIYGN